MSESVCMCTPWCCYRQMKASRSWLSSYSIIQMSASILSLFPLRTMWTHTDTHRLPESAWLRCPLPLLPPGQRHQDTRTHTDTQIISDLQASKSKEVEQIRQRWTQWRGWGGEGVTQPAPIPIQPHDFTLALGMHGAHKVKRLTIYWVQVCGVHRRGRINQWSGTKTKKKHRNALMNLFFFFFARCYTLRGFSRQQLLIVAVLIVFTCACCCN